MRAELAAGSPADPGGALYVDRRLRPLPLGGEAAQGPLSLPAGGYPHHDALRTAGGLHAGPAQGDRGRPAAQAAGLRRAAALAERLQRESYGTALVMPRTWKSALAPFLAGIPERAGLARRNALRAAQRPALRRAQAPRMMDQCAALALPARAAPPANWPLPELKVPPARSPAGATRLGLDPPRPTVALRARRRRPVQALAGHAYAEVAKQLTAAGGRGLGAGRARREAARAADHRRRRPAGARPHRHRPARRDPGACGRRRRDLERLRAAARRRRARDARGRHFWPDQPVALGAAQSDRRRSADRRRNSIASPATSRRAASSSPLHARYPGRAGAGGDATGARQGARRVPRGRINARAAGSEEFPRAPGAEKTCRGAKFAPHAQQIGVEPAAQRLRPLGQMTDPDGAVTAGRARPCRAASRDLQSGNVAIVIERIVERRAHGSDGEILFRRPAGCRSGPGSPSPGAACAPRRCRATLATIRLGLSQRSR